MSNTKDNIKTFSNNQFGTVRVAYINNELWFIASDICKILGEANSTVPLKRVSDDKKTKLSLGLPGGAVNCVTKAGACTLIGNRTPKAKALKQWIMYEVVPAAESDNMVDTPKTEDVGNVSSISTEIEETAIASDMQVFSNSEFGEIRTVTIDGDIWFVAVDVCKALDMLNPTVAIRRIDNDEKANLNLGLRGGSTNCVNEYGLYSLILGSRKKEAKEFKRWVTHEVLPSIRKHGAYMTPETIEEVLCNPDTIIKIATALKEEQEKNKQLTETNTILQKENLSLAKEVVDWDHRTTLKALVKSLAHNKFRDNFQYAWNTFYKRFNNTYNTNIRNRQKGDENLIDLIRDDEWSGAVALAIAMCKERGIDTVTVLGEFQCEKNAG